MHSADPPGTKPEDSLPGQAPGRRAPLRVAKEALRARTIAAREALAAPEHAELSQAIAARVAALPAWKRAEAVLLTLPIRSEWNTRLLAAAALASGKRVILPRIDLPRRMLALHRVNDLVRDVVAGRHAIPEPRPECERVAPDAVDWVLVPGVAFDPGGHRLGYGGGYYDRLLPLVPPSAAKVAGAFDLQVVDAVPHGAHDFPVDAIVTETRHIVVRPGAA